MDGTWCQKRVSGCGWNMVSEEGQWLCVEHGVRRGSVVVAATWCQKKVCHNTCSLNHVLYNPRDITTHSSLRCDDTVTIQSQMTLLHSPMSYTLYVTSQCIHHCTVTTRSQSTLMQSLIIMSCTHCLHNITTQHLVETVYVVGLGDCQKVMRLNIGYHHHHWSCTLRGVHVGRRVIGCRVPILGGRRLAGLVRLVGRSRPSRGCQAGMAVHLDIYIHTYAHTCTRTHARTHACTHTHTHQIVSMIFTA